MHSKDFIVTDDDVVALWDESGACSCLSPKPVVNDPTALLQWAKQTRSRKCSGSVGDYVAERMNLARGSQARGFFERVLIS